MIDIQLTGLTGDLAVSPKGDLVFGESDTQNIHDIINDNKGDWKQYTNVGVGIFYYLNSGVDKNQLKQQIATQLQKDNFNTQNMKVSFDNANSVESIDVSNVTRNR